MASTRAARSRMKDNPTGEHQVDNPVPDDENISAGGRADQAPAGAGHEPGAKGTVKRLVSEVSEDNLTSWAAALTYYFVLAMFPAVIALVSIVGLVFDPQQITDGLNKVLQQLAPGTAADTFSSVINQVAGGGSTSGIIGLIIGVGGALFTASGYVTAFTKASNVIMETPEGRSFIKLKPLQILITLIGILFTTVIILAVVASGPVVEAIGSAVGLSDAAVTVWSIAKWPVIVIIVAIMITVLYYMAPNVHQRGFTFVAPGAAFALVVWILASLAFAFYVANFGSYNKTYGTLAGVIVFLIWLWITNLVLLIGMALNGERERTQELKEGVPRAEKEIQLDARDEPKQQKTT